MSELKSTAVNDDWSVEVTVRHGDKVKTLMTYPAQTYSECVATQFAIVMGLFNAGSALADANGDPLPTPISDKLVR